MRRGFTLLALLACVFLIGSCAQGTDDTTIANDIKAKMFSDPELKAANLDVSVKSGVVTLNGLVPSAEVQLKAYKLAAAATGVTKVSDQMTVAAATEAVAQQAAASEPPRPEPKEERAPPPPPPPAPKKAASTPVSTSKAEAPAERGTERPEPSAVSPAKVEAPAATARNLEPPVASRPAAPQPVDAEFPAGTLLSVRMLDSIDSSVNRVGESFRATLDAPLMHEGNPVAPVGAEVIIRLERVQSAGRMTGRSELELSLDSIVVQGKSYQLSSNSYEAAGKSRGKDTATKVGIGAGIGAAIGAIAGGGKGAAIGAAVGAGGGTAIQVATRGQQVRIPSETFLEFRLEAPARITYTPGRSRPREER